MATCCCALAGTSACIFCNQNPSAQPNPYMTTTSPSVNIPLQPPSKIPNSVLQSDKSLDYHIYLKLLELENEIKLLKEKLETK